MLRRFSAVVVGSVAVLGLCTLQACSASSSTQAAGSPTTPGASPASSGSSAAVSGSPSSGSSSSAPATAAPSSSNPVVAQTATAAAGAPSGSFTVPAVSADVVGYGSYQKINSHLVHVQVCAKRLGGQFVGVEAVAYNSDYSKHGVIASVIGPETPNGSSGVCSQINLFYTAHLKVYSFDASGGSITAKSAMKVIY